MADQKMVTIEGARLIWLNFSGRVSQFNTKGDREFTVVLPNDLAEQMADDGWHVKFREPYEEGEQPEAHIRVKVNFDNRPPRIVLLTSTARTHLNQDTVEMLDHVDIENVDLVMRGYDWEVGDKSGTKAYLKTMFVKVLEDDLERKYAVQGD